MKKLVMLYFSMCCLFFLSTVYGDGKPPSFEIQTGKSPVLQRMKDSGIIKVGINPYFKPFSFIKDNKRVGIDIDMAKLLAQKLGIKCETVIPKRFSDLIPMVQKGHIDLIMADMTKTFDRAKAINFTKAYFKTGLSIMINKVKAGKDKIPLDLSYAAFMSNLKRHEKEKDLIIAVTRGKAPSRIVRDYFPLAQVQKYETNDKAAQAVLDGYAHIMIHDELFLKVWVNDHRQKTLYKVVVFPEPFKIDYYAFGIQKGNQEWLNMLNVFVMELKTSGYFDQLMKKYMN
ncbi:Extracellular solute-binding protein, family 3 [Candidatus Magnetomorum sp. HK-1]|nr:Extracellular solute-binding protein, family 3 [Candidatus Magnetomorum sp. HK-1]